MHKACENGEYAFAELLMKYGADVNARTVRGITPLHYVAARDHTACMLAYSENYLAELGSYSIDLLSQKRNNEKDYKFAVQLIKEGADINTQDKYGRTPLMEAREANKGRLVEKLIACGANVNLETVKGISAINMTIARGEFKDKMANILLDAGADLKGEKGYNVLRYAIESEGITISANTLKRMIECRACVNNKNPKDPTPPEFSIKNPTPLMLAASRGDIAIVQALIKAGVDVNVVNCYDMTALDVVARHGNKEMLKILHDAGAIHIETTLGQNKKMDACIKSIVLKEKIKGKVVEKRIDEEDKLNEGNTGERIRLPKMTNFEKFKAMRKAKKELLK